MQQAEFPIGGRGPGMPIRLVVSGLRDFDQELVNLAAASIAIEQFRCIDPDGRDIRVDRSMLKIQRVDHASFIVVWWPEGLIKRHGAHKFVYELRVDGMPYREWARVDAVDPIDTLRRLQ